MADDPELEAMLAVHSALETLDDDARSRVLAWAADRYRIRMAKPRHLGSSATSGKAEDSGSHEQDGKSANGRDAYEHFADLYHAADPKTETDRALVGGYWFHVVQGDGTFTSYRVNEELRNMGHPVSNITRAYDRLQAKKPALVRQVKKSGRSKQSHKIYKLTGEGVAAVEAML